MTRQHMKILVIDLQAYWRTYVAQLLRNMHYQVSMQDSYKEALQAQREGATWDLVLLGCASITQAERLFITHLIAREQAVIVLATALSLRDMRSLFLQGVLDVTDKTYHPAELGNILEQAQRKLEQRERPWTQARKGGSL